MPFVIALNARFYVFFDIKRTVVSLHPGDESLAATLKEKDEQISGLQRALADKERRCKDLELALTLLGAGNIDDVLDRLSQAHRTSPVPLQEPRANGLESLSSSSAPQSASNRQGIGGIYDDSWPDAPSVGNQAPTSVEAPAPRRLANPLELLILERSTGVYDDNWLKPRTSLAISSVRGSKNITLILYLPEIPGGGPKQVRLKPNFCDAFDVEVPRGERVPVTCSIPALPNFTPRINLDTDAEPRNNVDLRDLGVVLISIHAGL